MEAISGLVRVGFNTLPTHSPPTKRSHKSGPDYASCSLVRSLSPSRVCMAGGGIGLLEVLVVSIGWYLGYLSK